VRLVYVDEAGLSNAAQEPFLTVGGVIVRADDGLIPLEKALDALVEAWIPPEHQDGFVFHAKDLFNGGGKVFHRDDPRWPLSRRLELADELAALPARHSLTLTLGVVFKAEHPKPEGRSAREWLTFLHGLAFLSGAIVAESWLRAECPGEVCMILAEDNDQARSMIRDLIRMNQDPKGISAFSDKYAHLFPLTRIKEDPLFQPKRSSSVLQLADFWAYVAKKRFMKDPRYARFIEPMWPQVAPAVWPHREIPG
jgi:hypothetical protein